jgi:creatinine amidohydrolase
MSGRDHDIFAHTTDSFARLVESPEPVVILIPVGCVEPHGPHLSLGTDTVISEAACARAARALAADGVHALVAPAVPYGVTRCAASFHGAVSVDADALTRFLRAVIDGWLETGADHVCLVNNHLEPAHDEAVRAAAAGAPGGRASVACPLTRRWARTLSDEFKSGECHAGQYETSIVQWARPDLVDGEVRRSLPAVPVSLARQLENGVTDFVEMGLEHAYAGDPAAASSSHGDDMLDRLAVMIATEVREALDAR